MKATGIVRRIDDLGRIVIPKEIRRSFRIKEGDPSLTTLKASEYFLSSLFKLGNRLGCQVFDDYIIAFVLHNLMNL